MSEETKGPAEYEPNEQERTKLADLSQQVVIAKVALCDAQHAHEAAIANERAAAVQVEQAQRLLFASERQVGAITAFLGMTHGLKGNVFSYDGRAIQPER